MVLKSQIGALSPKLGQSENEKNSTKKTKHEREAPRTHFQSNKTNREAFREIPFFPILPILEFEKFNFGGSDEEKATFSESDRT